MGQASFSFNDHSGEVGVLQVNALDITAANFTDQNTARLALLAAVLAITNGNNRENKWANITRVGNTLPSDANSRRETKFLVRYEDATNRKRYSVEVPCADLALAGLITPGTDLVILTQAAIVSFITAFEAFVRAPTTLNPVTVLSMEVVGRDS